jgi:hypothetical protein
MLTALTIACTNLVMLYSGPTPVGPWAEWRLLQTNQMATLTCAADKQFVRGEDMIGLTLPATPGADGNRIYQGTNSGTYIIASGVLMATNPAFAYLNAPTNFVTVTTVSNGVESDFAPELIFPRQKTFLTVK